MTSFPRFAPDAKSQWRELPVELQELVLDDLERLSDMPPATSVIFHDVSQEIGQIRHYVFLRSIVDQARHTITVIGVKHVQK